MCRSFSSAVSVAALVAVVGVSLSPGTVRAFCGFYVGGADAELVNKATMVVMMRDGTRTVLAMQNNYEGPPENFAMVVPVPVVLQEENVRVLGNEVFQRVDHLAAPRLVEYWEQDPCYREPEYEDEPMAAMAESASAPSPSARARDLGVTIEAQFVVGEYDIVILSARDSGGLDSWLRQEGYSIPDGAEPVLRPYVEADMKFFVAKVDVSKVRFVDGRVNLSPLRFHYDSEQFSLPVRLGTLNSSGAQDLVVHILAADQRYEVANYPNVTVPTNLDVADEVRERFGEFYAAVFDETLARNPRAIVTEYAWQATGCDPCPGPVLSESDLTTLGADVLPSLAMGSPQATARSMSVTATGDLDQGVATAVLRSRIPGAQACYQSHIEGGGAPLRAPLGVTLTVAAEGTLAGRPALDAPMPSTLAACLTTTYAEARFPPSSNGTASVVVERVVFGAEVPNGYQVRNQLNSFVLTRLHARYTREALNEDIVFRQAGPIVGGREFTGASGKVEQGSSPAGQNNFQARYAIRHAWTGPIECENPVRNRWGGPPAGSRPHETQPATDLAYAPRGSITLPEMLRQDVPELEITGVEAALTAAQPTAPTPTGVGPTTTGATTQAEAEGCGGCALTGARSAGTTAALALVVFAWLARRRRS